MGKAAGKAFKDKENETMSLRSRKEMEEAIREGGSVLYGGRIVAALEELPSKAELARGNAEEEAAVAAEIDAPIAALSAQRAKLGTRVARKGGEESGDAGAERA